MRIMRDLRYQKLLDELQGFSKSQLITIKQNKRNIIDLSDNDNSDGDIFADPPSSADEEEQK